MKHSEGSARELLAASLGTDPWEQLEELRQAGQRKAKAAGIRYQMDKLRDVLLARIKEDIEIHQALEGGGSDMSESRLTRLAHADPRYRKHINGLAAAVEEEALAESEYWAIRSVLEWDRAAIAHMNALSRLEDQ